MYSDKRILVLAAALTAAALAAPALAAAATTLPASAFALPASALALAASSEQQSRPVWPLILGTRMRLHRLRDLLQRG